MSKPPRLTVITPTGGRVEAWALCQRWMARQDFDLHDVQWIVVDDCDPAASMSLPMCQEFVRPFPRWEPGQITLARNLLAAIPHVAAERIAFIEDDDWYSPQWLSLTYARLESYELVAEQDSLYYNVAERGWMSCGNREHGSLFQMGVRRTMLPLVALCAQSGDQFVDWRIWQSRDPSCTAKLYPKSMQSVGIKGMPGRHGIGCGHKPGSKSADPDLKALRSFIGRDADIYREFYVGARSCAGGTSQAT